MTNPMRGEALVGEQKIVVDFNGFCSLEAAMGKKVGEIMVLMDEGISFTDLRTCVRVFAADDLNDDQAGEIIGTVGYAEAVKAISAAISGFFKPKGKDERPLKAA